MAGDKPILNHPLTVLNHAYGTTIFMAGVTESEITTESGRIELF